MPVPDFSTMNETDVREIIVRPLLDRLGYRHGTQSTVRTEVVLRYDKAFLGRKKISRDPPLAGRADYVCDAIPWGRFVVEVKAPSEALNRDVREQTHSYAAHPEIAAAFFIITNGRSFELYRTSLLDDPLLKWDYSETEEKIISLFNILSPQALEKLARLVRADHLKPLARGVASRVRIIGGHVQYDGHEGSHEFLARDINGLKLPVTGGFVQRDQSGKLHARVEVAGAAMMMRDLSDVLGIGDGYDFFSASEYLSGDIEQPTIFQNFVETKLAKGDSLSVPGLGKVPSPFRFDMAAFTEAVGFVEDRHFIGTMRLDYDLMFSGIDPNVRQVLENQFGRFPDRGRMAGVGQFEIEFLDNPEE